MTEKDFPEEPRNRRSPYGHPENDLTSDFDSTNRPFPSPHSPEELSESPDPVVIADKNQRSMHQAVWYAIGVPVTVAAVSFILLVISRIAGGPLCEAGEATWICTESARIWWPVATSALAFLGLLGCAVIMVRKLNARLRWWPWMAAFWWLLPLSMLWATSTLPIAIMEDGPIF